MTDRSPYDQALQQALALLSLRARTQAELLEKLAAKGHAAEVRAAVLERLRELRYVDDERFARDYCASRAGQGKGPQAIRAELLRKGVPADIVTETLRAHRADPSAEQETVLRLARARLARMRGVDPRVASQRLMGFLMRRGFTLDVVKKALSELSAALRKEGDDE